MPVFVSKFPYPLKDTLLWSLANTPQKRKVNGHTKDISPHVRELATTIGLTTDEWKYVTEPNRYARQKNLQMHPKMAAASALAAVSLIAACTPARPTITPETTRPAITQTVETTEAPTATATVTATPAETPTPAAPEWQKAEYSGDLIICPNTQKPEDVLPNRSYQVQVEGQTVEINPQQYMIGLTIRDTERRGKNAAEISALETKYLSQDKTFDAWIRIANRAYVFSHAQQIGLNPADIANQSDEQIFWEVMQLSQLNHQILIPNPLEIRSWYQDYSVSHTDGSTSYDGIYAKGNWKKEELNTLDIQTFFTVPILGINQDIHRQPYGGVDGRQAALFALPGWSPEQMIMPAVYYQGPDGKTYLHYLTAALTPEAAMIHQGDFYINMGNAGSPGQDGKRPLFFADRDYQFKYGLLSPFLPIHQWTLEELIDNLGKGIYFFYLDDGSHGPQNPTAGQPFLFGIERANKIVLSDINSYFPWEPIPAPATPTP